MQLAEHRPAAALRPWIDKLWALRDAPAHDRERILPSGTLELVFNLQEDEFRIYREDGHTPCQRLPGAIVSGAYDRSFTIDTREHASVVGVHFAPGGAAALLGVPLGELRNAHVPLEALWGGEARLLRERLCAARDTSERFRILEWLLRQRLGAAGAGWGRHPAIPLALAGLSQGASVGSVVSRAALSHRRFLELFTASVGTTPKVFARICRFQRALDEAARLPAPDWTRVAMGAGYFDQSHMIREFLELGGCGPSTLRRLGAVRVKEHHLALPACPA